MEKISRRFLAYLAVIGLTAGVAVSSPVQAAAADDLITLRGYDEPSTPARYDKVRVLRQGPASAENVLVLTPGTSAGATNFRPMARGLLARLDGWQVWSIERRENLLEDHSVLRRYTAGKASAEQLVDYYLGWLTDPSQRPRFTPATTEQTRFAHGWGMRVAVQDVRRVVRKANQHDRTVVLGGHSLGGRITTAYASWNFSGTPGAAGLDGLVFIDGSGAGTSLPTAAEARNSLADLRSGSPFADLLGLGLPWASGVFNALGSTTATIDPDQPSALQGFPLVPGALKPPVPATNLATYGYSVDSDTSPDFLSLVHSHIGSLATSGDPRGWVDGELGSASRAASVFAARGGVDGTSWYHPSRLSLDGRSVNNGVANPAQRVLGVKATMGHRVAIPMFAFDAQLGGGRVGEATRELARAAGVPDRHVTTVDRSRTFAHIDPLSASPRKNTFIKRLVPFLERTARR